ncbi:DUF3304 domain-containing protein [Xanthomonas oryzae]|nr:DUF3304 domain-containing protein [Xanthomonas oryzae]
MKEKVVPIERYEKPGTRLNVHFLPEGNVRLLIWNGAAGSKGYKGPDAPVKPDNWPPLPPPPILPDAKSDLISPDPQLDFCCSPANSFVLPMFSMTSDSWRC